jgi:CysZ protein
MLDAAIKALSQMLSPAFRAVLLKSVGLAIALLLVLMIALQRLLVWLTEPGRAWVEHAVGPLAQGPLSIVGWMLAVALGLGLFTGAIFLMPAVTSLVASFFCDEIADHVERENYPSEPMGVALPLSRAIIEGVKAALLAIGVYILAVPFLFLAGFGAVIFFLATAYVLGRTYFELAAMRFHPVAEAKAMRRLNSSTIFLAGMFIAAFVSIPIINLATPLFGMAFMVHMHKRLSGDRPKQELLGPMQ